MNSSPKTLPSKAAMLELLRPIGQEHLARFWDRLSDAERAQLAGQISEIDVNLFVQLREQHLKNTGGEEDERSKWAALAARAEGPTAVRLDDSGGTFLPDKAREAGAAALAAGEVGMILVAGGLGTRLGFDHPKGMFSLGPLSQRPLFQIIIEQLRAVGQRFGVSIPLYLMTSPATDAATRQFLADNQNFGLPNDSLRVFCQATMWAVDDCFERILLETPSSLFLGPDGHGGMLSALLRSGSLRDAQSRGLKHFFYGQIDNPLLQVCDPLLVGSHLMADSKMTTQVVRKRDPLERVGNVVAVDGHVQVIEYSDLPEEFARQTNPDGWLKLWAGSLAVHLFDVAFLARVSSYADALPFHRAKKKVPYIDEAGEVVEPDKPNALRFERFIFDLLPWADPALVIEADPADAFAPVKNSEAEPTDTASTARAAMVAQHTRMLRAAGVEVAEGIAVELNPLWASTAEEIRAKMSAGARIERSTYFSEAGPREF